MFCECPNCVQPKRCCCFPGGRCDGPCICSKKPDPVEESIFAIKQNWWTKNTDELDKQLRALVDLARKQ